MDNSNTPTLDQLTDNAISITEQPFNKLTTQLIETDNLYLDGVYDREAIKRRIIQSKAIIGQHILLMGRDLIIIKERGEHGEFTKDVKEIGISQRTAGRYMSIAVKFNSPKLQKLVNNLKGEKGVYSKLLELSTESDEDLESLADGGTVAGLEMDDIDRMSARELREELRKSKDQAKVNLAAKDQVIKQKNEHNDKLADTLAKVQGLPKADRWSEDVSKFDQELADYTQGAEKFLMMVIKIVESMGSQIQEDTPESVGKTWSKSAVNTANRLEEMVAELQATVVDNFAEHVEQPSYVLSDQLQLAHQD